MASVLKAMDDAGLGEAAHPTEHVVAQGAVHHGAAGILFDLAVAVRTEEVVHSILQKLPHQPLIFLTIARMKWLSALCAGIHLTF